MIDILSNLMATLSAKPWLVAGLILLATFLVEDAATLAAGSLAVAGIISPPLALAALYIGIVAGDAGLYGLGRWAQSLKWRGGLGAARRLVTGRRFLRGRLISVLVSARFTPGMRCPTFLASGFLRVPFTRFFAVITSVAAIWTTGIFALIYFLGPHIAKAFTGYLWVLSLFGLGAVLAPMVISRLKRPKRV